MNDYTANNYHMASLKNFDVSSLQSNFVLEDPSVRGAWPAGHSWPHLPGVGLWGFTQTLISLSASSPSHFKDDANVPFWFLERLGELLFTCVG